MGSTTAYQCDGPDCSVLATRKAKTRAPQEWIRVTCTIPGDGKISGSFHNTECAHAWLDMHLGREED